MIRWRDIAAAIAFGWLLGQAYPVASDVMREPGGMSCDWWAGQPSILGGPMQPVSPTHRLNFQTIEPAPPSLLPALWTAGGMADSHRQPAPRTPGARPSETPAPVSVSGVGAVLFGLLAGLAIAWRRA